MVETVNELRGCSLVIIIIVVVDVAAAIVFAAFDVCGCWCREQYILEHNNINIECTVCSVACALLYCTLINN